MKATVNEDCSACGLCEETCPEVFKMSDEIAQVIADPIPEGAEDCAREAAEDCPSEAIELK